MKKLFNKIRRFKWAEDKKQKTASICHYERSKVERSNPIAKILSLLTKLNFNLKNKISGVMRLFRHSSKIPQFLAMTNIPSSLRTKRSAVKQSQCSRNIFANKYLTWILHPITSGVIRLQQCLAKIPQLLAITNHKNRLLKSVSVSLMIFMLGFGLVAEPYFAYCQPTSGVKPDNTTENVGTKSTPFSLKSIYIGGPQTIEGLGIRIMKFLNLTIAGIALIGLMVGGVIMITSAGNDNQLSYGKDIFQYSLIGLVITLAAYLIVTLVQTILYSIGA